jgi:catechol 2,3-dioxygenase-like lactoylglutathione lyase family enzyme
MGKRYLLWLTAACGMAWGQAALPLMGLSHVAIKISDPVKARAFYSDLLGFDMAGSVVSINNYQYIELVEGLQPTDTVPMTHIAMWTKDLKTTRDIMLGRGLKPGEIVQDPRDHTRRFTLPELPGQKLEFLEFVEYPPDWTAPKAAGGRRLSTHLEHAGIITTDVDAALKFYVDDLGFHETWRRVNEDTKRVMLIHLRMPGPSGDYVELSNQAGNAKLTRTRAGTAAHCSLEVPDIKSAYQATLDRGATQDRKEPRFGLDLRWQFNLFDPDGTRVELMQPRDNGAVLAPVVYAK